MDSLEQLFETNTHDPHAACCSAVQHMIAYGRGYPWVF